MQQTVDAKESVAVNVDVKKNMDVDVAEDVCHLLIPVEAAICSGSFFCYPLSEAVEMTVAVQAAVAMITAVSLFFSCSSVAVWAQETDVDVDADPIICFH